MTIQELAALAIRTLDQQQKYFKTRSHYDLMNSKALEKELREAAVAIIGKSQDAEVVG